MAVTGHVVSRQIVIWVEDNGSLVERPVIAETFGHWAVHCEHGARGGRARYSVTFVPKGLCIDAASSLTRSAAIAVAKELAAHVNIDRWDPARIPQVLAIVARVLGTPPQQDSP